ncbi:MAG: Hsp20/alpha crystallin family protein [Patescibacteria group bacterium]|jgi:HSP20 family protein
MFPHQKKSFFERLMGSQSDEFLPAAEGKDIPINPPAGGEGKRASSAASLKAEEEGEMLVDVYHTPDEIVIQAVLGGVDRDDIDISATQEMITIRTHRDHAEEVGRENYYYQELYWGTFSRSIMLPQEIDIDAVEANFSNGLLTIRLPKVDKERVEKIKVAMR